MNRGDFTKHVLMLGTGVHAGLAKGASAKTSGQSGDYYQEPAKKLPSEIVGYLFDSLRCTAKGKGKPEGNKEIMQWQWFGAGQGTSIRITEKISDNDLIMTEKYTLPDGSIMEDKGEMTRKNMTTEK